MKIYFLRHEEREKDHVLFRSTLNENGRGRANESLKNFLVFKARSYILFTIY